VTFDPNEKSPDASTFKGNDIDIDGDGSVNDAQTLQGNQPSDLGNSLDNNTIIEDSNGDIRSFGLVHSSDVGNIVSAAASTFSSNIKVVDISLASNEKGVLLGAEMTGGSADIRVDGNPISASSMLMDGNAIEESTGAYSVVFDNSLFIKAIHDGQSGVDVGGMVNYLVITQ
jgi:hypothetical protein